MRGRMMGVLAALVVILIPAAPAAADKPPPAAPTTGNPAESLRTAPPAATVGAASISAGKRHSCAITATRELYCWGDNTDGQLGRPASTTVSADRALQIPGLRAAQVDTGDRHTCAIDTNGLTYCYGDDSSGQLGGADPQSHRIDSVPPFVEITTGSAHTCGIDEDGGAWCWGDNAHGQIGIPGPDPTSPPTKVDTSTGMTDPVVDVAAGDDTTCAVTNAGDTYCWGEGDDGQTGDGGGVDRRAPVRVAVPGRAVQVSVGIGLACAVTSDGDTYCWGRTPAGAQPVPVRVSGAVPAIQVTAGGGQVCVLGRDGAPYCWGVNADGQVGDGSTTDRTAPVRVATGDRDPGAPLREIDAGNRHTCVLDARGSAYCWGAGADGRLGDGATSAARTPKRVLDLPRMPGAVTGVRATPLNRGLRVSWRPATRFGTGVFLSYTVYSLADGENVAAMCEVTDRAGTTCDLTGLDNAQPYDVTVMTATTDGYTLSDYVTATPRVPRPPSSPSRPAPAPTPTPTPPPGGGLPITGPPSVLLLVAALSIGLGLSALTIRRTRIRKAG